MTDRPAQEPRPPIKPPPHEHIDGCGHNGEGVEPMFMAGWRYGRLTQHESWVAYLGAARAAAPLDASAERERAERLALAVAFVAAEVGETFLDDSAWTLIRRAAELDEITASPRDVIEALGFEVDDMLALRNADEPIVALAGEPTDD